MNPGDVNTHKVLRIAPIGTVLPPAGAVESMMLLVYLKRFATNGADTYKTAKAYGTAAANLGVLSVDVHTQAEKLGTTNEIPSGDYAG